MPICTTSYIVQDNFVTVLKWLYCDRRPLLYWRYKSTILL